MIMQNYNPIGMVKELKGAALSILLLLKLAHQPVNNEWLAANSGYSDKTVHLALIHLKEIGLASQSSSGWLLTREAVQLPLTLEIEKPVDNTESNINGSRRNSDSVNYVSKLVVEENININSSSTNLLNLEQKDEKIPTAEEIQKVLDAAEGLFGAKLLGEPREYADLDRLLAWIAKAYDGFKKSDRSKVFNPVGLIYWAFHKGKDTQVEKKYLDFDRYDRMFEYDLRFLGFMERSGQWEGENELHT